jgi:hypothetical protein
MSIFSKKSLHTLPEGCHGVVDEDFRLIDKPVKGQAGTIRMVTKFACPGLDTLLEFHPATATEPWSPRDTQALKREHAAAATIEIAAACGGCALGPAAQLREDAKLRQLAVDELGDRIRLAELEKQNLELSLELGQRTSPDAIEGLEIPGLVDPQNSIE